MSAPGFTDARERRAPLWHLLVVAALFVAPVLTHEPVFGAGVGLRAAGVGVAVGLLIAAACTRWRWDLLTTVAALLAAHLLLGGPAALPTTTLHGVVPTALTLQTLVIQTVQSWKDLLTLMPLASSYVGPAVMPWLSGLLCSLAAGLLTVRAGRPLLGTGPIVLMGVLGTAFGLSGARAHTVPALAWFLAVLAWWAWAGGGTRRSPGAEVRLGRAAAGLTSTAGATARRIVRVAGHAGRRALAAVLVLVLAAGVGLAAATTFGEPSDRLVARDIIRPPLDPRQYPSPLAAFRHYTSDLKETTLVQVSGLPEGARLRLAAMDVYNGTTFTMSPAGTHPGDGYISVDSTMPVLEAPDGATDAEMTVSATGLLGPWVPALGTMTEVSFTGPQADSQQEGLHLDTWAQALLTTDPGSSLTYSMGTMVAPQWSDGQLQDVPAAPLTTTDQHVPQVVSDLAVRVAGAETGALGQARAIERYLSTEGYYSNEDTASSRPGHRADRLQRMVQADQLIGDDEQYAALMSLMLHSLGVNARVVMGLYPQGGGGDVALRGEDVHAWVEVEFEGVGWQVFDPTPPYDQTPQSEVPQPRSVPRPQVLQPPEPPDAPVELPPSTADKPARQQDEQEAALPWGLIAAGASALLLLVGPVALILTVKALRRRARRRAEPAHAVIGSWDEVVDLMTDCGADVPAHLTRQETAWMLTADPAMPPELALSAETGSPSAGSMSAVGSATAAGSPSAAPETAERETGAGTPAAGLLDWGQPEQEVPVVVSIARRADVVSFATAPATRGQARAAWRQVDALRSAVRASAGPVRRARRAVSLRSVRARRRRCRSARSNRGRSSS